MFLELPPDPGSGRHVQTSRQTRGVDTANGGASKANMMQYLVISLIHGRHLVTALYSLSNLGIG